VQPGEKDGTKRILIVDDDPDIHHLLSAALGENGRYFESAYGGLEGLDKFQGSAWDLVITDITMSGIDGLELLRRVRGARPQTPVVVMTVDTTAEKIVSAIRGNAFSWFRKPFVTHAVREVVDSALTADPIENTIEVVSATTRWLELRLRANLETATRAHHFVRQMETGLPEDDQEKVALAFREILFNAVEHGSRGDPDARVTVTYMRTNRAVVFRVSDPGPGFSFDGLDHAATADSAASHAAHALKRERMGMRPGGYGILLTRSLVDELIYNEKGNEALLIRYLDKTIEST
jgi:CheY-like chemotaxis protein/anti-sigma regulatory factor (Ser/Thr protein kinase)